MSRKSRKGIGSRRTNAVRKTLDRTRMLETLEPKQMLAGDPIISEFQATNTSTIQDGNGDYSDWIEITNRSSDPMNLVGWYLTDDANDLTQWQFPDLQLPGNDQVLVFASGDDVPDAAGNVHTNFRLSGGGEYLALVKPDGTIAQEFTPEYPEQFEDQSYGIAVGRDNAVLIPDDAPIKAFVPTNDSLGTTWTSTAFNDASWSSGNGAVGYEVLQSGFNVRDEFNSLGGDWTIDIPAGGTSTAAVESGRLRLTVPADQPLVGDESRGLGPVVYRSVPNNPSDFSVITHVETGASRGGAGIALYDAATGRVALQLQYNSLLYFRLINGDNEVLGQRVSAGRDSYFLRLERDSANQAWNAYFKINEADEWTLIDTVVDGTENFPGVTDLRVGPSGNTESDDVTAYFDFFEIDSPDESPVYGPEIGVNVGAAMRNVSSSVYMRIPFSVTGDPARFDELSLVTRFDDGFVAYLNGQQVLAENVPIDFAWNSNAEGEFGAVFGSIPVRQFSLSQHVGKLQQGQNVLSIVGYNVAAGDDDFFFDATMTATEILDSSLRYFAVPTPGEANSTAAAPVPQITGDDGIFFGSQTIELNIPNPAPSLEIRYTIDGSVPTETSTLYTGPFELTTSAMFQAKTFDNSVQNPLDPSATANATFIAVDEELRDRSSNVPIIILDSLGQRIQGDTSRTLTSTNVIVFDRDEATGRATLDENYVNYLGRGGIQRRGSSTAGQAKPNMSFEIWGQDGITQDDDDDSRLLGLANASDWVLHAPYDFDRAMMRNQLAFDMSNAVDQWAPHYRNVEVYYNFGDGTVSEADYHGLYVLMDKIERNPDRVDVQRITPDVTALPTEGAGTIDPVNGDPDENISGGYIWKIDRSDPDAGGFSAGGQTINWVEPKSPNSRTARDDQKATPEQEDWVQDYFAKFRATLNDPDINDPEGYSKYIDVDSWVDTHLVNVLMMNVDALRLSAYFHKDVNDKIAYGPIWDFDRSAESTDGRDDNPNVWRSEVPDFGTDFFGNGTQQWWGNLFDDPGFWQVYVDHWQEYRRTVFSDEGIDAMIDKLADEIEESADRNFTRWTAVRPRFGGWRGEVENMREWLHERAAFMDSNFAGPALPFVNGAYVFDDVEGIQVSAGSQIELLPEPIDVFNDTPLVSPEKGAATASYFVPSNNDLGTTWTQPNFNDNAWNSGPMGIGFSDGTFDDLIATRVNPDEVVDGGTTILIRTKFNIDSFDDIDRLVLRMKYDDGFVAYINGVEVAQSNIREELAWDSRASSRRNSDNDNFEDFDVSAGVEHLVIGENVLALRAINSSSSSNDQVVLAGLVSRSVSFEPNPNGVIYYTTDGTDPRMPDGSVNPAASQVTVGQKITIGQNTHVIARNFDTMDRGAEATKVGVATDWSGPSEYYFVTSQPSLAITEVNYNPIADADPNSPYGNDAYEFIEIRNTGSTSASLVGVRLNDAVEFDFSHSAITSIAPGGYVLVVANQQAFQQRYGAGLPVAGEYSGNLNNGGEDIDVLDGLGNVITSVNYSDSDVWPIAADGNGSTLELIDSATPVARQSKYYSWRASTAVNGTPGAAPIAPVGVVINEVLANPNQSVDSIELYNTTSQTINIGGWYLSDSANDLLDFRIPNGTQIGPNQYLVLNERDFGFGLSANGDQVWLSTTNTSGTLNRIVDAVDFGATKLGQSLGRTPNGSGRFAPLSSLTLGAANAAPQINSLIISELNYNPGAPSAAAQAIDLSLTDNDLEYVEVHNPTALAVNLTNWNIRGGVDYSFDDGVSIPAGGTLIVVPFNPDRVTNQAKLTAFRTHYGLSDSVVIVGGYQGNLSNGDDRVRLMQPEANPADAGNVTRYMVDEVIYDGLTPWPTAADGTGNSLQRLGANLYGNAAASWYAGSPTPGAPVFDGGITGDFNGNGTLDVADIDLLSTQVRTNTGNLTYDVNGDGVLNSADRTAWLALGGFPIGDSNLDGIFNSGDLVAIFVAGEYEDGVALNSGWGEGDWNGDGDFTTLDLVTAFQEGTYVAAATAFQQTTPSVDSVFADLSSLRQAKANQIADELLASLDDDGTFLA